MSKIIEMAEMAGFGVEGAHVFVFAGQSDITKALERFAALVGAVERERCAQIVGAPHWKQAVRAELSKRAGAIRALGDEVQG
jgi:hypothetical protein